MAISVFLADDHRLLVEGFRHTLKDYGVDVVEVAYSLDGLVDRYFEVRPDVLVVDVRFDNRNVGATGLDACEDILKKDQSARIIVFSQFDDPYLIEKTYKLGVLAFVRKDESTSILIDAINSVAKGHEYFSPEVAQLLAWSVVRDRNPEKLLDEKEMKVFKLAADGFSIADLAIAVDVSTKTVGVMLKNIKGKLGIENPAEFTKLAIRYGLTDLDLKTKN